MDWARAIERNTEALAAIAAVIAALLGLAEGAARISRPLHRSVLRLLQPAEAAVRRLIVIVARGLVVKSRPSRPMPSPPIARGSCRRPPFRLFDPRKRCTFEPRVTAPRLAPRIHVFGGDPRVTTLWRPPEPPAALPPADDGLIDGRPIARRLEAMRLALADLPRQARRLARISSLRASNPVLRFRSPLRPGPPPGRRKTPVHDVDFVLRECHALARDALADTS